MSVGRLATAILLGATGLVLAGALAWFVPSTLETKTASSVVEEKRDNFQSSRDGASSYVTQLAIAQSQVEKVNPLYRYQPKSGIAGRNELDQIYMNGVPATPQSVTAIRKLLSDGKLSRDEKIAIPRILAALHNSDDSTGANGTLELELKALARDSDKEIAAQAAIQFARMGYLPETESVLRTAFDSGALTKDSYYQELAHLVSSAPPQKQSELLAVIKDSGNRLASDVLANGLLSGQEFNAASFLKTSPDMAALLNSTQPQFSEAAGQFGYVDAVRYSQWLRASATIESQRTGRNMDEIITSALSSPGVDPRKIIGYLIQPQASSLLNSATSDSTVYALVKTAQEYAAQFPTSEMKDIVGGIEAKMANPPPRPPSFVFTPPKGPIAPPSPPGAAR